MSANDFLNLSPEALFRYVVISEVKQLEMEGVKRKHAIREVSRREHFAIAGPYRRISERTIYRWLSAYEEKGLQGLEPAERRKVAASRVLRPDFLDFTSTVLRTDPQTSLPEIIRQAKQMAILRPEEAVDRVTLWRACQRMELDTSRTHVLRERDTRRFAYPERMQMVLSDFLHFRAGATRARRVALFFLDDATRYGIDGAASTSENSMIFLTRLYEVIVWYGLMDALYLDRGPAFISSDTLRVIANLDIVLIHGKARYPEGHGKIERFNRTMREHHVRVFDRNPAVDPDLGSLSLRLQHALREGYNQTPHESLDGETPAHRWSGSRPLKSPPDLAWLKRRFILTEKRRVSPDHIIQFDGLEYEVPRGYHGAFITIYRHILEGNSLSILHDGEMMRIHPVDKVHNAIDGRANGLKKDADTVSAGLPSASLLAYDETFAPLVDEEGGFSLSNSTTEKED